MIVRAVLPIGAVVFLSTALVAQAPAPGSAEPPPGAAAEAPPPPPPVESYTYEVNGRRDPFLSLLSASTKTPIPAERVDGVAGLLTSELSVRGVLLNKGAYLAMVQGPDNRTYVVRTGDKLMDGMVKSVTPDGLVVLQDVNDPLSLVKQREVYRRLRALEDAKE